MKTYFIITYGCQMNTADSGEMAQPLKERGLVATGRPEDADIIVMNTCTVREQAEHRADSNLGRLREWKAADPRRILIVAGCAASRWGESIRKKYPFIDAVSPATRIDEFPALISRVLEERWDFREEYTIGFGGTEVRRNGAIPLISSPTHLRSADPPFLSTPWFGSEATAYVTTMRGCNYACTYCIVPQVRGREFYRPMGEIVADVQRRVADGYREIMLVGQTVNSYYDREVEREKERTGPLQDASTPVRTFSDLLSAVAAVPGVECVRFMSPHPKHFKAKLIETMAAYPTIARHVHLPLQSGSDRILARMRRLYTADEYARIIADLRAAMPDIQVTTDVIVGFPGETDDDFAATDRLLGELRFNGLFAFKYSPRPGTASAEWPDDVPQDVKEQRLQRVLQHVP